MDDDSIAMEGLVRRLTAELDALKAGPPLRWESLGETGDSESFCSLCGIEASEPHSWERCARTAVARRDGMVDAALMFEAERDALKAASGPPLAWFEEDRGPACHRCAECFTELEAPHTWAECIASVKERENSWQEMWLGGVEGPTAEQVRALRLELEALKIEHDRQYYRAQDFEERAEAAEEALLTLREAATDALRCLDGRLMVRKALEKALAASAKAEGSGWADG